MNFDQFCLLMAGVVFSYYAIRIAIAVKAPNVHRAIEEMEDKRRERNKKNAVGAFKIGLGLYQMFRGR